MLLNARYTDCPSAKHHERSDVTTDIQLANALEIERLVETNQVEQVVSTGDERKDRTVYQIVTWTADGQMSLAPWNVVFNRSFLCQREPFSPVRPKQDRKR